MWLVEIRSAWRSLRRAWGFTLAAIASIALGICGNVTIFSMVNAMLLRPLPYSHPDRLVTIQLVSPKFSRSIERMPVKGIHVQDWRRQVESIEMVESVSSGGRPVRNLDGPGDPARVGCVQITSGLLALLGVKPQLGRWFSRGEEENSAPPVAILGDSLWRQHFSADPAILGKQILFDGRPVQVVGIAPPGLHFFRGQQLQPLMVLPARVEVITPVRLTSGELDGTEPNFDYAAIARLKPGRTIQQARAEIDARLAAMRRQHPEFLELHPVVQTLAETLTAQSRRALLLLLGVVGMVLFIVCVNVANLMLVRGAGRRRELAIRRAIGAARHQLIRQSLAESVLLAAAGTVSGVLLASWILDVVVARAPVQWARMEEISIDWAVLAFAAGLCFATSILFGVLPAWRASRVSPLDALPSRGQTDGPGGTRLRAVLVSVEVALSTMLLISAGLLIGSLHRVLNAPRGFATENVSAAEVLLSAGAYRTAAQQQAFYRRLLDWAQSLPGVAEVGYADTVPLLQVWDVIPPVRQDSTPLTRAEAAGANVASWINASSGYFEAAGVPLRAGRLFRDEGEPELVAVVSESAAQRLWPGENPIGKRFRHPVDARWIRLVGVVGDVRQQGLDRPAQITIYRPFFQHGGVQMTLVVRSTLQPGVLARILRDGVWKIDRSIPPPDVRTMTEVVAESVAARQFQASLVSAFGALALALASVGVFGTASYVVVQRRMEIGLRLAIGAPSPAVCWWMLRRGMLPVFAGLAMGLTGAAAATRLMSSLLFEVPALDPVTFGAAPAILVAVAAAACYLPARQASRLDPVAALRSE